MRRLLLAFLLLVACARREAHPPVILISIDTLRSDHLPAYGYRGARTPSLDALASQSLVFRNAWSHVPLTLPSHLSIFTGLLPPAHGVRDNLGYRFDARAHPTLAATLRANGYRTGGAVSAYVLRAATGASAGFDDYDDAIGMIEGAPVGALQRRGDVTEKIAEEWIAKHEREPFFCFLHLYEPHAPYEPSYDAEIEKADAILGRFFAMLKQRKLYDRALIVVLSDHGEGLMEHGEQEHGVFLYREDLQVPLLVKLPHASARRDVSEEAQLIDVMPTVLDVAGVKFSGRSLLRKSAARPIYAESLFPRLHLGWSELRALVRGPLHFIDAPRAELYDVAHDPAERRNVIGERRRESAAMRDELTTIGGAFTAPETIAPEEAKKLAALGYVSAGAETNGPLPDPKDRISDLAKLKQIAALRPREAIAAIEPLLAANPGWSDLRYNLGDAYDRLGEHDNAAKVYEAGIARTPRLAGPFALAAGSSLLEGGRVGEAEAHAQLAASAGAPGAELLLAEIALAKHDLDGAARAERAAEGVAAERSRALFVAAKIAAARHDFPRALQLLDAEERERTRTGASVPQHFHYVAGDALAHLGRLSDAASQFEGEIAGDPGNVQAYGDLALLHVINGDRVGALAILERMAAARPTRATYLYGATTLENWGDAADAAAWRARSRRVER